MDKNQEWGRSKGAQNSFNKTGQSAYIYMTSCNKCWTGIQLHKTAVRPLTLESDGFVPVSALLNVLPHLGQLTTLP